MSDLAQETVDSAPAKLIQGYVDEIGLSHVSGWIRDGLDPAARIGFVVALVTAAGEEILAQGVATDFYAPLGNGVFGDGHYGFSVALPRALTQAERAGLQVLPSAAGAPLERAGAHQGFVDERSIGHVAGWVRNRYDPEARVEFEVVLPGPEGERVLARGTGSLPHQPLIVQGLGDGHYGFRLVLPEYVSEEERDKLQVRPWGGAALPLSPALVTKLELISFIAMDIVNNCNLRCPFCLYDYDGVRTTRFMTEDVFDSVLPLIPHVNDAGFWLSCLHEPSLHPDFLGLIERIPRQWRQKVMFSTNLAKRMPAPYFQALAQSGLYNINISLESAVPAIYEKFRKGARWPIFKENWDKIVAAWKSAEAPPRLRYILLVYRSNLHELPGLVAQLLEERCAWQVEVRYTFNMAHITPEFAEEEYPYAEDWDWLEREMAIFPADKVLLTRPLPPVEGSKGPTPSAPLVASRGGADDGVPPSAATADTPATCVAIHESSLPALPLNLTVEWDGTALIYAHWDHPDDRPCMAKTNITTLEDPYGYLLSLATKPRSSAIPWTR